MRFVFKERREGRGGERRESADRRSQIRHMGVSQLNMSDQIRQARGRSRVQSTEASSKYDIYLYPSNPTN